MQAEADGAVGIVLEPQVAVERDDFGPARCTVLRSGTLSLNVSWITA